MASGGDVATAEPLGDVEYGGAVTGGFRVELGSRWPAAAVGGPRSRRALTPRGLDVPASRYLHGEQYSAAWDSAGALRERAGLDTTFALAFYRIVRPGLQGTGITLESDVVVALGLARANGAWRKQR